MLHHHSSTACFYRSQAATHKAVTFLGHPRPSIHPYGKTSNPVFNVRLPRMPSFRSWRSLPDSFVGINLTIAQVDVILPKAIYSSIQDSLQSKLQKLRYARVFMSLSSLLEGDFFNTYIKIGILCHFLLPSPAV